MLRNCLTSVTKHITDDVEVIIIDDGSPDNSGKICDEFSQIKNVQVIHQKNQGVSVARNKGIEIASGEYIAFIDGDDFISNNLVTNLLNIQMDYDIIYFKYVLNRAPVNYGTLAIDDCTINTNELIKSIFIQHEPLKSISIATPWGKVYKRQFLLKNHIMFNETLRKSQDKEFNLNCLVKNPKIGILDYIGYIYVTNENSVCNKFNENILQYYKYLTQAFNDFINKNFPNDTEIKHYYEIAKYIFLYEICIVYYFHVNNPNKKNRISVFKKMYEENYKLPVIDKKIKHMLKYNIYYFIKIVRLKMYYILPLYFFMIRTYKRFR